LKNPRAKSNDQRHAFYLNNMKNCLYIYKKNFESKLLYENLSKNNDLNKKFRKVLYGKNIILNKRTALSEEGK
jgi:hypothetical protein